MPKAAIASTDGITINEHFGRAKAFLIYEVDDAGAYTFLERRELDKEQTVEADSHEAGTAFQLLSDVEVVLVAKIGPTSEQELRKRGIIPLAVTGAIGKALEAYGKRGKYIRNNFNKTTAGCCPSGSQGPCGGGCR